MVECRALNTGETDNLPQASETAAASEPIDPSAWVDRHGTVMYRYALVRVNKPEVAEELVQDALLAAWRSRDKFKGESTERTWLIGILRHKIMDHLRSRSRGVGEHVSHSDWLEEFFDEKGRWVRMPDPSAVQPEALLEREEFWAVFHECLDTLAPRAREAFARRVLEQEETATICKALEVTATNLWVILFRARTQLRRCLTLKWFNAPQGEPAEDRSE